VTQAPRARAQRLWTKLYPRLLSDRAFLAVTGAESIDALWERQRREPFLIAAADADEHARAFRRHYPEAARGIVEAAERILAHEVNLLGSGLTKLGTPLPWHEDFKTGRRWPLQFCRDIEYSELDRPSDVKVPWELSRCQHFTTLGRAFWLTADDRYAAEFVAEVSDWISANPYAYGVNWACAMDVALRAVSWIWGFHFMADAPACRDPAFRAAFLRALFLHGAFISTYLEKADLNGNHYLCDGVGLVFLSIFFRNTRQAAAWRATGRAIVEQEIFNQTTPDGVDFEQSTAYHRLVLEAFLTSYALLGRAGEPVAAACLVRLERMCEFVQAYTKPDGRAPLIGDADDGRVQILGEQAIGDHRYLLSSAAVLFDRADFKASSGGCWEETFWLLGRDAPDRFAELPDQQRPTCSQAFPSGGFFVLRAPDAHLIVDCGEVGMKGRGGHGHNDILSFELFLNGFNVVTDCGAYVYTASREWRNRFRGTAFHNTVQVDAEELNRFVGPDALWQLHYDAVPTSGAMIRGDFVDRFAGGHLGYQRLSEPVVVSRELLLDRRMPRAALCDSLSGRGVHDLVWRFHLDPDVAAEQNGVDVRLSSGAHTLWLLPDAAAAAFDVSLEPGWVSASYGTKRPTTVVVWRVRTAVPITAGGLFAESRLSTVERTAVVAEMRRRAMKAE
jgi:uncharacterized heparinase superfamily protein